MTVLTSFIVHHWLPVVLIVCSMLAILFVYKNRHMLLQTKTYNRRTKP